MIDIDALNQDKRSAFEKFICGDHVFVHLDATRDSVIVPVHLKGNKALTLKLSYYFQGKTILDINSITADLLFSGRFFECVIPWNSIWGMTSDKRENRQWLDFDISKQLDCLNTETAQTSGDESIDRGAIRRSTLHRIK